MSGVVIGVQAWGEEELDGKWVVVRHKHKSKNWIL